MVELLDLLLLLLAIALASTALRSFTFWVGKLGDINPRGAILSLTIGTVMGCLLVAAVLREPVPRITDEFSYTLMGDTFAHGHFANPSPPLQEFFDTFHVLVHPVYASKYFPAQGVFLAIGEKLTSHPAVCADAQFDRLSGSDISSKRDQGAQTTFAKR
jgi:hypothetical protein